MSAHPQVSVKHQIKLIGGRWHRWDRVSEDWLELPPHVAGAPTSAAIEYSCAFFNCKRRDLDVDMRAP